MEQARGVSLDALKQFSIPGELVHIEELKRGHINRTFVGTWSHDGVRTRYVHQVVNHRVFRDIEGLMGNLELVTKAVGEGSGRYPSSAKDVTLSITATRSGKSFVQDDFGEYWRTSPFIEKTMSFDVCPNADVARESGAILGRFQRSLLSVDPVSLAETIPYFMDSRRRFGALKEAIESDTESRVRLCGPEIEFALTLEMEGRSLNDGVESGRFPLRVSHNDMKLNNVLFDAGSSKAVCLLDLDTCMAGTILYDFGDLVRNTAVPCAEDERDLSKIHVDPELYSAIYQGYIIEMGSFLSSDEKEFLPIAPRVLALTLGVRFLSDYLSGDTYFRIHRQDHNLDRARAQFQIVRALLEGESTLRATTEAFATNRSL
jgi:hypothetical protein